MEVPSVSNTLYHEADIRWISMTANNPTSSLFSGFPYPVPWHKIPLNIYYILHMANTWRKDTHRKEVAKYLKRETGATLRTPVDLLHNRPAQTKILVSTLPELDFPLRIPDHVIPCGPILRDAPRVSDSDPELEAWLAQGSTIYLNLGSICQVTGNQASELALALKNVLMALEGKAEGSRFQVLWKLKRLQGEDRAETDRRIESILGDQIKDGLVRIVEWIQVEPVAIFFSGHVACSIHHGGANSYNEAVR
jgi:hypothetical protein